MKSLTLVLCVIALLGSAASTFFYIQIGDTKTKLEQKLSQANASTTEVKGKLAEAGSQLDALQKRLAGLDTDLGETKSKLTTSDNRNVELARNVDQLTNQVTAKDDAAKALNDEIAELKRDLAATKLAAAAASPEEIDNYKKTIATLQSRVSELEAAKPAPVMVTNVDGTVTAQPQPGPAAAAGISGTVASIGKQNAFVVINIGADKGIQIGQKFAITRGTEAVAAAVATSIEGNYSIAQIVGAPLHGNIAKGDVATVVAQ